MPVHDYIARVIEINNYLAEFPPTIVGRNATKLPDDKLLNLLEFRIPIKWQRQMQVKDFEPTAGTLRYFQDVCKRLESALNNPVTDDKSNKMSRQEKGNKKRRRNNKDEDKKHFCMLHEKKKLRTAPKSAVP